MNLVPRVLSEWFRGLRQRFFFAAVRVTAEEAVADLEAESIAVKKRRLTQSFEALDFAKQLDTGGDEAKERILAAFREDILDVGRITDQVQNGRIPFEEGREAIASLPPESGGSATSLPTASTAAGNRALPDAQARNGSATPDASGPSPESPAKRRGRPRKYPRPEGNGPAGKTSG